MLKGLRFRPAGWVAAIGTVGAMAATMVIAAPGGAATPEKEFTASFKQECVVGPGSLNQKGTAEVHTRATGPESLAEGESGVEFHNATSTITFSAPGPFATLYQLGVRSVKRKVIAFELVGRGLTPTALNIAKPAAFPEGLPFEAPVEENKPTSLTIPHEGSYTFGPYTVTGKAGENAALEVGSESGFTEPLAGEYEGTGKGMVVDLEGLNETGGHLIGPLPVVCTAPKGVVLASIPIGPGTITTSSSAAPGEVEAWGSDENGMLANAGPGLSLLPRAIVGLNGVSALSTHRGHALALLQDGSLQTWGEDTYAQLGLPVGTVHGCGESSPCSETPLGVPGVGEVAAVAGGAYHSLALLRNGTVLAWGANSNGQLGDGSFSAPATCRNATPCSATPVTVSGLSNVVAIAAGTEHSLALLSNGTVMAWGYNADGELGNGSTTKSDVPVPVSRISTAVAIAAGGDQSLALLSNGTVMTWGDGYDGELGNGTHGELSGGSLPPQTLPVSVTGLSGVKAISASESDDYALLNNGTVMAWGDNLFGELGDGTSAGPENCENRTCSDVPVPVNGLSGVTALAAGGFFALALRGDHTVAAWGLNNSGELGTGNAGPEQCSGHYCSTRPVTVMDLSRATSIAAGYNTAFAIVPAPPVEKAEFKNWKFSGAITDKKLAQPISLPSGSTFNGSGELNTETGAGSVSGNLVIPAFTAPLKLFGVLPVELGMKLTPEGSVAGTVAKSETISGDETLTVPVNFGMGITSVSLLGLKIPTTCATTEPLSLSLVDNLTREELLMKGWSFAGSTTIPKIKCEGGLLGGLFGAVLSALLSGPENAYTIKVTAP
jgi:alpha-tubulin suppressor-like RCC1 family protein